MTPTYAFVVADTDGDGNEDLVRINFSNVVIDRGRGDGTFEEPRVLSISMSPYTLKVADLNADGHQDLVSVLDADFVVAYGDAVGGFGLPQHHAAIAAIASLALADLDGDGSKDIVGLTGSGSIAVALNSGTSLSMTQIYSAGPSSTAGLAIGDVTGDGHPDVVVTSASEGSVSVLRNTGAGALAARASYMTTPSAQGVVLADLDQDGDLDVAVGTRSGGPTITILLNQGAGLLGTAASYSYGGPLDSAPMDLAAADVNGDGHIDIGAAGTTEADAVVLLGSGTGQLGMAVDLDPGLVASEIAFADLDHDGRTDVMLAEDGNVVPYMNNGLSSLFELRAHYSLGIQMTGTGARLLDLDDSRTLDLVGYGKTGSFESYVPIRLATSPGTFAQPISDVTTDDMEISFSSLADVDNDGRQDLLLLGTGPSGGRGRALLAHGNGTLAAAAPFSLPARIASSSAVDVDNDGLRDLVVLDTASATLTGDLQFLKGHGDGTFTPVSVIATGQGLSGFTTGDLDGDGNADVILDHLTTGPQEDIFLGHGDGTFAAPMSTSMISLQDKLALHDFNGDGRRDLISFRSYAVVVRLGQADGSFAAPLTTPDVMTVMDSAYGDVDGDGHLDVVSGGDGALLRVLRGRGDGTFRAPLYYSFGDRDLNLRQVTLGDVDGDGRLDILIANRNDVVSILYGRCLNTP